MAGAASTGPSSCKGWGDVFGDEYPRFVEVSELTANPSIASKQRPRGRAASEQQRRMNARYEALFACNRDVFDGARVLDLAVMSRDVVA
jgi:hypothetical protein